MTSRSIGLCIALSLLTACGGGGDDGGGGGPASAALPTDAALDGYVDNDSGFPTERVVTDGVGRAGSNGVCRIGPPATCWGSRTFLAFELISLPATAVVQSATLRVYQESVEGVPYDTLGALVVDHVDVGPALDESDYDVSALTLNLGTLSTSPALEWKSLDVTAAVNADRSAGRTRSDFRVRFLTGADGSSAVALFTLAEDVTGTGNPPRLVLTYTLP